MRLIAGSCSVLALIALIWAGQVFWEARTADVSQSAPNAIARQTDAPLTPTQQAPAARWPAMFGELEVVEPQPPAPSAPPAPAQPPKPAMPPLASLGYSLKGVVRDGDNVWAMVSHPTGDVILRVGDNLVEGMVVDAIDAQGLWVRTDEDRALLAFPE